MESTFDLRFSTKLGRFLEARKNFKKGDRIFEEAPLMLYPLNIDEDVVVSPEFVCYGCCKIIVKATALHCPRCNWYACSEECVKESWHTEFECKVFDTMDVIPSNYALKQIYLVRSLLLKDKDEVAWRKMMRLSSSVAVMTNDFVAGLEDDTKIAYRFLTDTCRISVEKELVGRLVRLFRINCFGIWDYDKSGNKYWGSAIYAVSCYVAHSCNPNADWQLLPVNYDNEKRWHIVISACKKIKAGKALTIPYSELVEYGTMKRRAKIAEGYNFHCSCDRCADPTELKTYYSAIVCGRCLGVMLPKNPLNFETNWKCILCGEEYVKEKVNAIETRFKDALDKALKINDEDESYKALNSVLENNEKCYGLYCGHNLMVYATMTWLEMTDLNDLLEMEQDVSLQYEVIVKRAKRCLRTHNALGNWSDSLCCETIIIKASIMYWFKSKDCLSIDFNPYHRREKIKILELIIRHLGQAIDIAATNLYDPSLEDEYNSFKEILEFYLEHIYQEIKADEKLHPKEYAAFLQGTSERLPP